MPLAVAVRELLEASLPAQQLLNKSSEGFASHSKPWSMSYDKSPALVVCPSSERDLAKAVKLLYDSSADFAIRGTGTGSSSAADVIISMQAFRDFTFDEEKQVVEIGAGLTWGDVDSQLSSLAPEYLVVGARCPYVGVVGSTLAGGLSWLSHEFGLGSDPSNMQDARIVLRDGRVLWASEEPDLLWALRGGGGNFGVVTTLRLTAHKYSPSIFSGMVKVPTSSLEALSKRVARWATEFDDPKTAMHVFITGDRGTLHGDNPEPVLLVLPFDAHGEEHARSEAGFKWLFDIEGAAADVGSMPLAQVHGLQRVGQAQHGTAQSWLEAALVSEVDENFVIRARNWYADVAERSKDLAHATFVLLEIMQSPAFTSAPENSTAWPHGGKGRQHVLQLSTGGEASSAAQLPQLEKRAFELLAGAPAIIGGKSSHPPGDFLPNFLLPFHDTSAVFGANWSKLRGTKSTYDPADRFNKGTILIPPAA